MQKKFKIENNVIIDHRSNNNSEEGFLLCDVQDETIIFNKMIATQSGSIVDGVLVVDIEKYNTPLAVPKPEPTEEQAILSLVKKQFTKEQIEAEKTALKAIKDEL